jgi:hypothetical protein
VLTYYTPDELMRMVEAAGLEPLEVRTRAPQPHEHHVDKICLLATAYSGRRSRSVDRGLKRRCLRSAHDGPTGASRPRPRDVP